MGLAGLIKTQYNKVVGTTATGATPNAAGSLAQQIAAAVAIRGNQKLQGSGTLVWPAAAGMVTITDGGGAWVNGSYVQFCASTSEADYLLGWARHSGASQSELDVATGGAGAETVIATICAQPTGPYYEPEWFPYPIAIPISTRVAVRGRDADGSGGTQKVKLFYCKQADLVAL